MPVRRIQQILFKKETSEGEDSVPTASDAVLVYEPDRTDDVPLQERVPAGPSLDRDFVPVGLKQRTITFQTDFRGSGDTSIPITQPDFGKFGEVCALREIAPVTLPITSPSGTGFQVGEVVQKSASIRGVVIGCFLSGALTHRLAAAGNVIVAPLEGTFTTGGTLTGESSGTTATIGTVAAYAGVVYAPTSKKEMNLQTATWSGGTPTGVGDVLTVKNSSGVVKGAVQLKLDVSAGTFDDIDVTLLWGAVANGDSLVFGAFTALIDQDPVQTLTPSGSAYHNLDGRRRSLLGARGTFVLAGESGSPLVFSWSLTGSPGAAVDTLPVATSGLSTVRPPRYLGAIAAYGKGAELYRLPTGSFSFDVGNTANPNTDANNAGGITGSNVSDRNPKLTVQVDDVHSAFDWEAARDDSTAVRTAHILGSTPGNIVGFVAPNCQVESVAGADKAGIAAFDVVLAPRRVNESGDDSFYLFQL